jgi:hypothetical protein
MAAQNTVSRIAQTVLKVALSGALLYYLVRKASLHNIVSTLSTAHIPYYFAAIILYIISQPLRTLRWGLLLRAKQVELSQIKLLALYFIGMFFSNFLPTIMGGDVVRGYYIYKESHSHEVAFGSVVVERLCGLVVIVTVGFISSLFFYIKGGPAPIVMVSFAGCCAMLFIMAGFLYQPLVALLIRPLKVFTRWRVQERVNEIYLAILSYKNHSDALLLCVALSLLFELVIILIYYVLSVALSWGIPFYFFLYTVPVITIVSMIPISFGGLGVREGATVLLFSLYGISAASAIALSLLSYSISLITGGIGGIVYPFYTKKMANKI